jgi:hypothetical protein
MPPEDLPERFGGTAVQSDAPVDAALCTYQHNDRCILASEMPPARGLFDEMCR